MAKGAGGANRDAQTRTTGAAGTPRLTRFDGSCLVKGGAPGPVSQSLFARTDVHDLG